MPPSTAKDPAMREYQLLLARVRYRVFGKYEQCMMPSAESRERFIDI